MDQDKIITVSSGALSNSDQLPEPLRKFYAAFAEAAPGYYDNSFVGGMGFGMDDFSFGPVNITVDNTRVSVVDTSQYVSNPEKDMRLITIQGYAQITLFDRFYATCILIGQEQKENLTGIVALVDHLSKTDEEREELKQKGINEVSLHPSFYTSGYNDPINAAESTYGVYIISDRAQNKVSCDTVLKAMGIADFADNTAFGLAIGVRADINTFKNSMNFTVAASVRFAGSERFTVAGELGLLNGKINSIALTVKTAVMLATEIYLTKAQISVSGFQETKIAVGLGGSVAFGEKVKAPEGLGIVKKAFFPNLKDFYPIELTVDCEINPARSYYSMSGQGLILGNFAISAGVTYDDGDWDAKLQAGTIRGNYINGSLSADYHKRKDNWSLHGNFNCSLVMEWKSFVGITVSGGVDLLLNSQDYKINSALYNRKDLTITVSGMGKIKLGFTFSVSVQKTWVFNLSNKLLSEPKLLMKSLSTGEMSLDDYDDVLICESEDIADINLPQLRVSSDVISSQSWQTSKENSDSNIVTFQVASQYTLVDSSWLLTYSSGDTTVVYTAENASGIVAVKNYTHNYYELVIDSPAEGNWTLSITGDSKTTGGIYMDALSNEKIFTELNILEATDSFMRFSYSAYTQSGKDTLAVRLFAEELPNDAADNPFSGIIANLEETANGEFIWEIPENFRNNSNYRFYISAASSEAALPQKSNSVELQLDRLEAQLECDWELVYSADNTNVVTAYITITNSGASSTTCRWELLDYTNTESIDPEDISIGNTAPMADVIASGKCTEIAGNSSVTFQQVISITDELRNNSSALQLTVSQCNTDSTSFNSNGSANNEAYADDAVDITFSALNSIYCQKQTITWQAVEDAASYVVQYALEGDWENGGVYINNITDNRCTLSVAPGEYAYRVIAMDKNNQAIGSWSEAEEFEVQFYNQQTVKINENSRKSRSQTFSLNDGIYDLSGSGLENFTGTLTLYRNDLVRTKNKNNTSTLKNKENKILTLKFVNGKLTKGVSDMLLDNGEYFWEYSRTGKDISTDSQLNIDLSGEVFSAGQKDRDSITIGGSDSDLPQDHLGNNVEKLTGEVGFCNADAIYQYLTNDGGDLSLTISSGTVFESKLKLCIYVQNDKNAKYTQVKTITVNAGEYTSDKLILDKLSIKNNFYIQIISWDNGKGKYNTDYSFDLSFDAFEDNTQSTDIIEVDGEAVSDWIGYRNEAHKYLLQIDSNDLYAVRLQGDAADAVLKVCNLQGKVIKQMQIQADGTAYIDGINLTSGNYFVVVESKDKGKGKYNTAYTLSVAKMQTLYPTELIDIDGSAVSKWVGFQNPSHTYRLEVESDDRYAIRLQGDAAEAVLKICNLQGKVIKQMQIKADKTAYIDDIALARGNYFVVVESKDKGKGKYNTDYTLSVSKLQTLYPKIDNSDDTWKLASLLEGSEIEGNIEDWLGIGDTADYFKISLDPESDTSSYLAINLDEATAQAVEDGILKFTCYTETGRSLALTELEPGQLAVKKAISGSEIYIGVSLKKSVEEVDYAFDTSLLASL